MKFKEYKKAINLVEKALIFKPYAESKKYRLELDYLQTTIFFVAGEYSKAFDSFRIILTHESENLIEQNAIWNLFALIVNKMLDKRHHRYTLRLLFKKPKLIPLIIQNGNNSHLSGTYKYAIGICLYVYLFACESYGPLTYFLIRDRCLRVQFDYFWIDILFVLFVPCILRTVIEAILVNPC